MKLFIVTRWGNPHEKDGPDGKDTNFLVRAASMPEAALLADELLQNMSTSTPGNRPVQSFVHCMKQIGEDLLHSSPAVVHGPWIEYAIIHDSDYDVWHRDEPAGDWINISEEMKKDEEV